MICMFVYCIFMSDWFLFAPRYGLAKASMRFNVHDTSRNVRTSSTSRKTPCPWIRRRPNRLRPAREATSLWTTGGARIAPGSPEFWGIWLHIIAHHCLLCKGGWSSLPQVSSRLSIQPCKRCSCDALFRVVYFDGLYVEMLSKLPIFLRVFRTSKSRSTFNFLFSSWDRALVMPSLICWPPFKGLMIAPLHLENLAIARRVSLLQHRSSSRSRRLGALNAGLKTGCWNQKNAQSHSLPPIPWASCVC